jgi:hypothetical protein
MEDFFPRISIFGHEPDSFSSYWPAMMGVRVNRSGAAGDPTAGQAPMKLKTTYLQLILHFV